jgi:hypothetical protein
MTLLRVPGGQPRGGQFAAARRSEADVDLSGAPPPGAAAPSAAEALAASNIRPFTKTLGPAIALRSMVEDETDDQRLQQLLPSLSRQEVAVAARDISDAITKAGTYSDELAAEQAPAADELVDLEEFGGWERDRPDEGEYFGYDFAAYAMALSEAWNQESIARAKAAVAINDSRAAAAS